MNEKSNEKKVIEPFVYFYPERQTFHSLELDAIFDYKNTRKKMTRKTPAMHEM